MDLVGQVLCDRYRVLSRLGAGGMGTVYLAEHVYLGRPTALKILRQDLYADEQAEDRFRREAMLAARITHPAVAQVYDFDRTPDGEFVLAMEYVDGETVAHRLRREGAFTVPFALRVLRTIAGGLDRAHALNILHRDLKPDNVMLAAGGGAKLLDFGVARPLDISADITSSGFAVGTPAYMSPEQLMAESLTPASDIYSLGIVCYEMLSGQLPLAGTTIHELRAQRLTQTATPLDRLRPECTPELAEVVARALEAAPERRWPSAGAFADAATEAAEMSVPTPAPVRGPGEALDRWEVHFEALRYAGREREVRQVRDAWAAARARRTTVLWIEGDEGAGKSAFFALAQREAMADGARALLGRGYDVDINRPFGPWLPLLREGLALPRVQIRAWPAIAALLEPGQGSVPDRGVLFDEIAALLHVAAGHELLFVGMEDLDSCDLASTHLYEFLASHLRGDPILLAASLDTAARLDAPHVRDAGERLRRLPSVERVNLRPLGHEAVYGWLQSALGREPPDPLVRYVYGQSEGNAFFIEQVVRGLVEEGDLDRVSDERAYLDFATAPAPEAVAEVVRRRLERLSPAAREVIQMAAVIGREFDAELVLELSRRSEDGVLDAIDEAITAGILTHGESAQDDWYRFTHGKIGQVHAQRLNPRRRRALHAQIAGAMEARSDTPPALVAWHWYHAGERSRATPAALAAAAHAMTVHDHDDALTFAVMAAETAADSDGRRAAHTLRGDALRQMERHPEAAAAYARAQLDTPEPTARTQLRLKEMRSALAAGALAPGAAADEAERLASAPDLAATDRPLALLLLAEARLAAGDAEATAAIAQNAVQLARDEGYRHLVADGLVVLGSALQQEEDLEAAHQAAVEARALYLDLGDGCGAARAALLRSGVAADAGNAAGAEAALDEAARLAERTHVTRLIRQVGERRTQLGASGTHRV